MPDLGQVHVIRADARRLPLPDASVDLIVTSPPYFALRDYGYDGQIGGEPTPQAFLGSLWECTREWVRVLKPTGSLWVNLGDKYNSAASGQNLKDAAGKDGRGPKRYDGGRGTTAVGIREKSLLGLPWRYALGCIDETLPYHRERFLETLLGDVAYGDLAPEQIEAALREYDTSPKSKGLGLILRAEIVWSKPSALPESVTDRVRRSHEQWFHFVRQPRYYSAVDEIREPHGEDSLRSTKLGQRSMRSRNVSLPHNPAAYDGPNPLGKLPGSVWSIPSEPLNVPDHLDIQHYAAFPSAFPVRIIRGWSPPGICTTCRQGRRPVVDSRQMKSPVHSDGSIVGHRSGGPAERGWDGLPRFNINRTITGYACACTPYTDHPGTGERHRNSGVSGRTGDLNATDPARSYHFGDAPRVGPWREYHFDDWTPPPTRPAVVLDPMGGTGTTALVARALGRIGISVDLSEDYCRLARWRTSDRGELARVLGVAKPPRPVAGQLTLEAADG